jgi:hypothetical protein
MSEMGQNCNLAAHLPFRVFSHFGSSPNSPQADRTLVLVGEGQFSCATPDPHTSSQRSCSLLLFCHGAVVIERLDEARLLPR